MEDLLFYVDSEGSTLLHLAVESGSTEVGNIFKKFSFSQVGELVFMYLIVFVLGGTALSGQWSYHTTAKGKLTD